MKPRCLDDTVYFIEKINCTQCPSLSPSCPDQPGAAGTATTGPDSLKETVRIQPGVLALLFYLREFWLFFSI